MSGRHRFKFYHNYQKVLLSDQLTGMCTESFGVVPKMVHRKFHRMAGVASSSMGD